MVVKKKVKKLTKYQKHVEDLNELVLRLRHDNRKLEEHNKTLTTEVRVRHMVDSESKVTALPYWQALVDNMKAENERLLEELRYKVRYNEQLLRRILSESGVAQDLMRKFEHEAEQEKQVHS